MSLKNKHNYILRMKKTLIVALLALFSITTFAQRRDNADKLKLNLHIRDGETPKINTYLAIDAYLVNGGDEAIKIFDPNKVDNFWGVDWAESTVIVGNKVETNGLFVEGLTEGFKKRGETTLNPGDSLQVGMVNVSKITNIGEYKVVFMHEHLNEAPREEVVKAYGDKLNEFTAYKLTSDTLRFRIDFPLKSSANFQLPDTIAAPFWYTQPNADARKEFASGYVEISHTLQHSKTQYPQMSMRSNELELAPLLPYFDEVTHLYLHLLPGDSIPAEVVEMKNLMSLVVALDYERAGRGNKQPMYIDNLAGISKLKHLKRLDLGPVRNEKSPAWLGDAQSLEYLSLAYAFDEVGDEIGKLKNLKYLNIASCRKISGGFEQAENLAYIDFSGVEDLAQGALSQMKSVETVNISLKNSTPLDMTGCKAKKARLGIHYQFAKAYPIGLEAMPNLEDLSLVMSLPSDVPYPTLAGCKNLKRLEISNSKISALPPEVTAISSLQQLDLMIDKLASLPEEIAQLTRLKSLNVFRAKALVSLPQALGAMPALEELDIPISKIGTLPANLGNSRTLKSITITKTELLSDISVLMQMPQLETINVSDNKIAQLPDEIVGLVNLKKLYLARNPITSIPSGLKDMPNLQTLDLNGTSISDLKKP